MKTLALELWLAAVAAAIWSSVVPAQPKVEKMPGYPNLGMQGVFGNPAKFCELGNWLFPSVSYSEGTATMGLNLSKNMDGVQLHGGVASGNSWMMNASVPLFDDLKIGGTFSSGNREGVIGAVYTLQHTDNVLHQIAAEHDFQLNASKLAGELRFRLLESSHVSISGNLKRTGRKLEKGIGVGFAPGGNPRLWAGFGGNGWRDMTIAAQMKMNNNALPEAGLMVGKGKKPSFYIGATVLIPR
ncbi:TPA: hypothetical protein HA243_04190 [Candidatus Micrarchaeota archaeon]|nr:hypothetical protein [Candidatus Micrarchaeota archaeon]